jgi:hypothetical protein
MGIFDINMPLLYGEGSKAFIRLQHEIIKVINDNSILAHEGGGFWASFLDQFITVCRPLGERSTVPITLTSAGVQMSLLLCPTGASTYLGILDCVFPYDLLSRPAILLERRSATRVSEYYRRSGSIWIVQPYQEKVAFIYNRKAHTQSLEPTADELNCKHVSCGHLFRKVSFLF